MFVNFIKKAIYFCVRHKKGYSLDEMKGEVNINLGCGNRPISGFINTDFYNREYADEVFDLNYDFPFANSSCDLIYSDNVFEHVHDTIGLVDRCYKCLKTGGVLIIKVPYFKSKHAFVDPTHVKFFTIQTFDYFVEGKYFNQQYRFTQNAFSGIDIYLDADSNSWLKNIIACYAIRRPNHFENSILSSLFVFHNIVFVLRK